MNNETVTTQSYLSFKLGEEMFATGVENVKEILSLIKVTKVPQSPSYMMGVINLRGLVLPVVDTRQKFGLTIGDVTEDTCIIVLNIEIDKETLLIGALVDSVLEVFELSDDLIKPSPSIGNQYKSEFIRGMVKKEEALIMLLNLDKVFSTIELLDLAITSSESESKQ